jgi:mRNA-degrading endonuclease RelE of RelBE toxin-antitoxin system
MMRLWIEPAALDQIAALPGYVRQRIRRAVSDLRTTPRPTYSRTLAIPSDVQLEGLEACRLRIDSWRVLYVIDQEWQSITVLAIRKRPPYNYEDLSELLGRV